MRAIESVPASCLRSLNSASIVYPGPPVPVPCGRLEKAKLARSNSQQDKKSSAADVKRDEAANGTSVQTLSLFKAISKPQDVPVRNRRKVVLKLEQELEEKQAELARLQEENRQLKQKEKLLQVTWNATWNFPSDGNAHTIRAVPCNNAHGGCP